MRMGKPLNCSSWMDRLRLGGDVDDRKSTNGYVYTFAGRAITWRLKKQAIVSLSSTEVEYVATSLAVKEGIWLKAILEEINLAKEKTNRNLV